MNRSLPRRCLLLFLAVVALLFSMGCMPKKSATLRVGINAWPGYEFLYLAQEKGFYRDEGLDVRLVEFNSLSDARRAYERGQIDVIGTTVIEVLQARDNSSRSPQIVQVIDYSDGADVILARPGITSLAGLRGKRVGVELASLGIYILARGLEKNQMGLGDVEIVSVDQTAMEGAFRKGELDAIVTYPPTSTMLLRDGKANIVFSSAQIAGEVIDVIAVEEAVNVGRAGDVAKLLRAYHRAIAYMRQHPADACRIMAEREGITAEEFHAALTDGLRLVTAADQLDYLRPGGKLEPVIIASDRILRHSGQIKKPNSASKLSTAAFAKIGSVP